jgi:hypothetical protein
MSNKLYSQVSVGEGPGTGTPPALPNAPGEEAMPEGTASWPGLPGKSGPDRSCGSPKEGTMGRFNYAYTQFSPPKLGTGARFASLKSKFAKEPGVTNPGALAATIGRKKYGNEKMAAMSAAGKKK